MAQTYEPGTPAALPRLPLAPMPRPQVSIERLPTRRMSNEPRESMNCKSCRKRKIKCNRLRPACEACQVFQCPCIYDAVPKKRGPKTDVLEALLKRVDGLEARLKNKKANSDAEAPESSVVDDHEASTSTSATSDAGPGLKLDLGQENQDTATPTSSDPSEHLTGFDPNVLLDIYFARFHDKPFHVFDESTLRQRLQLNQVPGYLVHAIYAVAARYAPHPSGYQSAVKLSEEYAAKARLEIDTDEPSVDALQGLVLLVTAFTASGKGKKAYMLLTSAVGMAMALELHRELDMGARITPIERETRRRLFWTCYLLDRFLSCGSKRPSLISDRAIVLRLPCWFPSPTSIPMEGDFFQSYTNLQQLQGGGKKPQGSNGMLIDICRILGTTNQYLAAGGVKGDSHFPWHSLSNLSKIRQDLDVWASGSEDVFSSVESLFGQPDSTVLVLSKLIYHLIHCLIYRPFLPIDLAELAGSGQHQSWQIEATNMCFLHANAIAELVELGKQTASVEWPAFVGYCICTAGTVHIHGAHYSRIGAAGEVNVFSSSTDFLSREMQQLSELRYAWASVQHQRETLQGIYNAHSELVKSIAQSPTRYSPVFTLEDFFDRYSNIGGPGGQSFSFDSANLSLADVVVDFTADTYPGQTLHAPRPSATEGAQSRPNRKRKNTAPSGRPRPDLKSLMALNTMNPPPTPSLSTPSTADRPLFSPGVLQTPTSLTSPHDPLPPHRRLNARHGPGANSTAAHNLAGFSMGNGTANPPPADLAAAAHGFPGISNGAFAGSFNFAQLPGSTPTPTNHHHPNGTPQQTFDPMFGGIPTNAFSTPTAWHGDEAGNPNPNPTSNPNPAESTINGNTTTNAATATGTGTGTGGAGTGSTPKDTSPHESAATTGPGEEKDPFLSLLEQLAENESFLGGVGPELDFFLNGAPNTG